MKKKFAAFVAGTVIAGVLSGCAAAGSPSSAPSSQPAAPVETRAPAPATAEPESRAQLVTVTAESITVTAEDGSAIATFDYFQPTEELVAGMTEIFDLEPTQERFENHAVAQTLWEWDGFFLVDNDGPGDPPHYTNHFVRVTVPVVGEVGIETVDGIQVGNDAATIERRYPDQAHRVTAGEPTRATRRVRRTRPLAAANRGRPARGERGL